MTDTTRAPIYGPWKFTEGDDHNPMNGCIYDVNGTLLSVRAVTDDDDREIMQLMAAAPEMLGAMEYALRWVDTLAKAWEAQPDRNKKSSTNEAEVAGNALRAAIAKAKPA